MAGTATTSLEVVTTRRVATDAVELTLREPGGARLPDWTPGAHLDVVVGDGTSRQYSLCGDRWDAHAYRIVVRRDPDGRGGSMFLHGLRAGDLLRVSAPRNAFHLSPAAEYHFVAGGIGISPLLPMLDAATRLGTPWRLDYVGRRVETMPYAEELGRRYGDRVRLHPTAARSRPDLPGLLGQVRAGTGVYACGPADMLAALAGLAGSWPESAALRVERFTRASGSGDAPFEVELRRSGMTRQVPRDRTLLETLRDMGADVMYSCTTGSCGTCVTVVLEGDVDHRDVLGGGQDSDVMFPCVSRARSPRLVLDL